MKQKIWTNWLQGRRLINNQKPPNKQEPMIRSLHWWIPPNIQRWRPILLKFFQKIKEEGTLSSSFYEPALHWCQNQTSMPQEKKNYRLIALMNINVKILNKISTNTFNNTFKGSYTMIKLDLFQGYRDGLTFTNQCNTKH